MKTDSKTALKEDLTRGRPGAWETDLVHFIVNGNIN
jgi:hypothetical protein